MGRLGKLLKPFALKAVSIPGVMDGLCRRKTPHALVLCYHRITAPDGLTPPGLCVEPEDFRSQLGFLLKHYRVVTATELARRVKTGLDKNENLLAVTFDDGFIDNYTTAFPILKEFGIPGTFYVLSDHLGAAPPLWQNRVWEGLLRLKPSTIEINGRYYSVATESEQREVHKECVRPLYAVPPQERNEILNRIRFLNAKDEPLFLENTPPVRYVSEAQIQEMAAEGMEIGAHTQTHPVLATLDDTAIVTEIAESKKALEQITNRPVTSFAIPFGAAGSYPKSISALLASLNFEAIFTTDPQRLTAPQNEGLWGRVCVDHDDHVRVFLAKKLLPRYL